MASLETVQVLHLHAQPMDIGAVKDWASRNFRTSIIRYMTGALAMLLRCFPQAIAAAHDQRTPIYWQVLL